MAIHDLIKTFDSTKIRVVWDDEKEKYYFSVVDVIGVLTESADARTYWKVLKHRLVKEGNESVTNCNQLKLLAADGYRFEQRTRPQGNSRGGARSQRWRRGGA